MDKLMINLVTHNSFYSIDKTTKTMLITFNELNIANRFIYKPLNKT